MKKYTLTLFALATAGLCFAQSVKESDFGKTKDGELVKEYTLKNNKGTEAHAYACHNHYDSKKHTEKLLGSLFDFSFCY